MKKKNIWKLQQLQNKLCQTISTHSTAASESWGALEINQQIHDRALQRAVSLNAVTEELSPQCIPTPQCVIKSATSHLTISLHC